MSDGTRIVSRRQAGGPHLTPGIRWLRHEPTPCVHSDSAPAACHLAPNSPLQDPCDSARWSGSCRSRNQLTPRRTKDLSRFGRSPCAIATRSIGQATTLSSDVRAARRLRKLARQSSRTAEFAWTIPPCRARNSRHLEPVARNIQDQIGREGRAAGKGKHTISVSAELPRKTTCSMSAARSSSGASLSSASNGRSCRFRRNRGEASIRAAG